MGAGREERERETYHAMPLLSEEHEGPGKHGFVSQFTDFGGHWGRRQLSKGL